MDYQGTEKQWTVRHAGFYVVFVITLTARRRRQKRLESFRFHVIVFSCSRTV